MRNNIIEMVKPTFKRTLVEMVEHLRTIDRELKSLTKLHSEIKEKLIKKLGNKKSIYDLNGHEIATYTIRFRKNFDKKVFELSYPGVYEKFEYKTEYKVLNLK